MSDNGNGKRQRNDEEEADADSSDQRPTKSNKSSETASGNDSNTDAAVVAAEREETTSTAKSKEKAPSDETEETATTEEPAVVVVVDRTGATEEETAEPAPKEPEEAAVPEPATAPIPTDTSGVPPLTTGPVPAPTPLDPTAPAALAAAAAPNDPEQVLEETGQVSALYIGRVIGKGGEMIRDLQARSGSRMDVEQKAEPGQPRIITYRGTRKTIDFAKQLVAMLCQEGVSEQQMPLGSAMREILIIPAKSVGKVIGRGGEMIRELQGRSQAKIQVDHSGASGIPPDQKQVTITGTDLAVTKAKEMVMFLVANPMMDAMQSIQMLSETKTQGGTWGSGGPYDTLPNQGVNMQPQSMPGGQGGYGGGYPGGGGGGGYQQPAPGGYGGGPPGGGYGGGAPQGGFGGAPQQGGYQAQQSPGQYGGGGGGGGRPGPSGTDSDVTFVAKSYMGRIIGSKGVTINDLQRRSGADIQINQDVAPGQDCPITLRGNRQAIELAKQMIQEVIEVGPGHPYAGGADQGGGGGGGGYGGGGGGGYQQQGLDYGQQQQQQPGQFGGYGQQGFEQPQAAYGQSGMYGQQAPQQQYGGGGGYPQQQAQSAQQQQYPGYGQPGAPPPAPVASEWQSATSPDGQMYYFNARTGATQWDKPAGMP